jgi:site-specific DNA recombinase
MMPDQSRLRNGVLAVRVSTPGQGIDGDSPDAQIEQGERYAPLHNIKIIKTLTYLESASKAIQPMQNVVDYAIDPKNGIDVVIVKSIDRFTRGGSTVYDQLKMQLGPHDVDLVDIYGVINNTKVNTLEHLGMQYGWSVYTPSRKTELLEAERAKDEVRDILSRMIGSEIRYTQLGYWMRKAPYGMLSEKVETTNGKRVVLREHPEEGPIIKKMYELRAQGTMSDDQIAEEMNRMGYKSAIKFLRSQEDRTRIIATSGGKQMTGKLLRVYVKKTIYAGVNCEKWTGGKPVKCRFNGLITVELFNKANRGKISITPDEADPDHPIVGRAQKLEKFVKKNLYNGDFPYRKVVMCPTCRHPLLGSASRGRLGKYYPAYHCSNHGHYFRVPKPEFDATVDDFASRVIVSPERVDELTDAVLTVWKKRQGQLQQDVDYSAKRRQELETQIKVIVDKMKLISSATAIKYMEEDLMALEQQITKLDTQKEEKAAKEILNMPEILMYVNYFMKHIKDLLLDHCNPITKAQCFGVIFDEVASYEEISNRSAQISQIPGVNELFKLATNDKISMVRMRGLEPPRLAALTPQISVSTIPPHPRKTIISYLF